MAEVQHKFSPCASLSIAACIVYLVLTVLRSTGSEAGACPLVGKKEEDRAGRVVI